MKKLPKIFKSHFSLIIVLMWLILPLLSARPCAGTDYTVGTAGGEDYATLSACITGEVLGGGADDTVTLTTNITDSNIVWTSADAGTAGHPVIVNFNGKTIDASGGSYGIFFAAGANYVTLQGTGTLDGGNSASDHGIKLASANTGTVIGITISDLTIKDFGDDGISSNLTSSGLVHTVTIDGCTISGNGDSGIQALHPGGVFHTWTITNNIITGNTKWGIRVYHTSESRDSYGFIIDDNTVTNNGGPGIVLRCFTDTIATSVCNNTVTGNGDSAGTVGGVWFMDCYGITADGNWIGNNGTTGIDGVGLYFDNRCDVGCSGRYNWIYGHNDSNSRIEPPTDGHLTCAAGIAITNADNIVFEDNVIFDNFVGARLGHSGSASAVIQNNTFVNNVFANVKLQNYIPAVELQNNIFYGSKYSVGCWQSASAPSPESNNCYYGATIDADYGFTKHASSITTDPAFTSEGTDDYTLTVGSDCIDGGTTGSTYGLDPATVWTTSILLLAQGDYGEASEVGAYIFKSAGETPPTGACDDDFSGTTIDTSKWTETDISGLLSQDDVLIYSDTGTVAHTAYLDAVWTAQGNFSLKVNFDLTSPNVLDAPDSGTNLAPRISISDGTDWVYVARFRGPAMNGYAGWGSTTTWDAYADADDTGRLYIERTGSVIKVGVWNGSSYEWNGGALKTMDETTTDPVTIRIWFAKQTSAASTEVTVDLDNFQVISGCDIGTLAPQGIISTQSTLTSAGTLTWAMPFNLEPFCENCSGDNAWYFTVDFDYPASSQNIKYTGKWNKQTGWTQHSGNIYKKLTYNEPTSVMKGAVTLSENDGNYGTLSSDEWDWDSNYLYVNVGSDPSDDNIKPTPWEVYVSLDAAAGYRQDSFGDAQIGDDITVPSGCSFTDAEDEAIATSGVLTGLSTYPSGTVAVPKTASPWTIGSGKDYENKAAFDALGAVANDSIAVYSLTETHTWTDSNITIRYKGPLTGDLTVSGDNNTIYNSSKHVSGSRADTGSGNTWCLTVPGGKPGMSMNMGLGPRRNTDDSP